MWVGYARVSKDDGSQSTALQRDALLEAGVDERVIYEDRASGAKADRPLLEACLRSLREGDTLVVWKLDRLGRSLRHLVTIVEDLTDRGVGIKVLSGQGAAIDTTTASGKLVFGIFAALAEFERELISERTKAGLASARARGRRGGRPYKMTPAKLRLAMAAMADRDTHVGALCVELDITRQTLYRHVSPTGELREDGRKLLAERPAVAAPRSGASARPDSDGATPHAEQAGPVARRSDHAGEVPVVTARVQPGAKGDDGAAGTADELACPGCGYRPTRPRDLIPHREDLATVWLHVDGDLVSEGRHCARCQPHDRVRAITCSRCGDGPLLTGTGGGGVLPAAAADWLRHHGWTTTPELICDDHA